MRTETPHVVRLEDYRPPSWLVDTVELDVQLHETETRVRATLALRPNEGSAPMPLSLDGDELQLASVSLDGAPLDASLYEASPERLTIAQPPQRPFRLTIETVVNPSANKQLMGLYRSGSAYCTQCEAEGFRRITYFPDRPDIMAVYTTRIEADRDEAPVLLANGNLVERGEIAGTNRHFAVWHDPFPKPSYLFAMVGGRLGCVEDSFVTMSGRNVTLQIYVEPGKEDRCGYAMDALKRSMRWDEEAWGREYDLDIFMIVAVSDFNMGAMENKGLNVFNDKYVLVSPTTATDADYANVEAIIAHEYFHNWTGNRITCRDWFQLCLKEGLTVFRDQEFTSDERSRPVKRIRDVRVLRVNQFVEDAGPLAHPVRPAAYREINNFYTATVYEKGAEVVRMLQTLIGREAFRAGMDLYFDRHDGEAATIEQFLQCFADASGADLAQFKLWYAQAGTPEVVVTARYDPQAKTLTLELGQMLRPTPGQPVKEPMVIPLVIGLLDRAGRDLPLALDDGRTLERGLLTLTQPSQTFTFTDIPERPVLSLNRNFSAPINLVANQSIDDLIFLAAHDADPFNRWQAVQTIALGLLVEGARGTRRDMSRERQGLIAALGRILDDGALEHAFVAQTLALPSQADIARELANDVDPDAVYVARQTLRAEIARALSGPLSRLYEQLTDTGAYSPDAKSAGRRALRNACLDLLAVSGDLAWIARAMDQYRQADNMTNRFAALATLATHDVPEREEALADFYRRYAGDPLIVDKWFALQAGIPEGATLDRVKGLLEHPAFSRTNPNRVRSVLGVFAHANPPVFNRIDGAGYAFIADQVLSLDGQNPQVAAGLLGAFETWRSLEAARRGLAQAELQRIARAETLSADVRDIVDRSLAEA